MEEKLKSLRLSATRLAKFERMLGTPLTKLTDDSLGFDAMIKLLQAAGMADEEIDQACDELGLEAFITACMEVLMNSGLFKQAKTPTAKAKASK